MVKAIETHGRRADSRLSPLSGERCGDNYELAQLLVSSLEIISFALVRRRVLSVIGLCSIVWLTSIWLAAAIAQAQESSYNSAGVTATEPAIGRRSIEKEETGNLVLSMVDRGDLEPGAPGNSTVQLTNPHRTDSQNAGKALLPSNPRGTEYASLAALASAPPSSLLHTIQTKDSQQADTSSLTNGDKALAYRFGRIDFVVNQLPNSFSVSSHGNSVPDARQ